MQGQEWNISIELPEGTAFDPRASYESTASRGEKFCKGESGTCVDISPARNTAHIGKLGIWNILRSVQPEYQAVW